MSFIKPEIPASKRKQATSLFLPRAGYKTRFGAIRHAASVTRLECVLAFFGEQVGTAHIKKASSRETRELLSRRASNFVRAIRSKSSGCLSTSMLDAVEYARRRLEEVV
ncbi:hypothetical protein EVAR_51903_1 [Eumeta japonica]|uniref:Uncharacterized protein n=1 Tax=Eumeta variegata TaxID=151549 RepID=A0A4C1XK62_EUMVA|nr:hypothetical protein EVAR_51903_1 [Eumeta japonica]